MKVVTVDPYLLAGLCRRLEKKALDFNPDAVVTIASGGSHVGNLMFKDLPHYEVSMHRPSTHLKRRSCRRLAILKRLPVSMRNLLRILEANILALKKKKIRQFELPFGLISYLSAYKRILIIDDAVDSGSTLRAVHDALSRLPHSPALRSAVLTVTTSRPLITPDYNLMERTLLRFPWSLDYTGPTLPSPGTAQIASNCNFGISYSPRPLVVVDLDGTLINGNTLHIFIISGLKVFCFSSPMRALSLAVIVGLRSLRLVSHRCMKKNVARIIKPDKRVIKMFKNAVQRKFNHKVTSILNDAESNGYAILLATAALDTYVPWIWDKNYIATPASDNPGLIECRGELKLQVVNEISLKNNLSVNTVITDHHDDLPLISAGTAHHILLVNPSATTRDIITMAGITYKTL